MWVEAFFEVFTTILVAYILYLMGFVSHAVVARVVYLAAVLFLGSGLIGVNFWNFMGAGVFGFVINLPVVDYYQHGTYLTVNHVHAALFGVYGNLAIEEGYAYARSNAYVESTTFQTFTWLRGFGAALFFFGGVLPIVWFMVTRWFSLKPAQDAEERLVVPPTVLAVADVPGHREQVFETAGE